MLSIQPMHHNQIDRQSVIDKITAEYNAELYEIRTKYDTSKKILDDKYNLAIKQINAIYDAYEVTLGQLYIFKSELLKDKLLEFPDFEYYRLNTTLSNNETNSNIKDSEISIKLPIDILMLKHSIIAYCAENFGHIRDDIRYGMPLTLKCNSNNSDLNRVIKLNNSICAGTLYSFVIKERDIVILWHHINDEESYKFRVNIIKISTGKLIYNDICNEYAHSTNSMEFMYCNRQIISYYLNNKSEYIFSSYTIDDSSNRIKVNINRVCIIKLKKSHYIINNQFYGDERGLYLCCNGYIYFIGKLDKGIGIIDLRNLDKLHHKIKLETNLPHLTQLTHYFINKIDYITCSVNITFHRKFSSYSKYILKLGVSDACTLL